jgi:flagellar biosynthesis protein FliR
MNNIDLIGIAVLFIIVALPFYILYKVIKSFEYQPIKTQISEQDRINNLEKANEFIFFIIIMHILFGRN